MNSNERRPAGAASEAAAKLTTPSMSELEVRRTRHGLAYVIVRGRIEPPPPTPAAPIRAEATVVHIWNGHRLNDAQWTTFSAWMASQGQAVSGC